MTRSRYIAAGLAALALGMGAPGFGGVPPKDASAASNAIEAESMTPSNSLAYPLTRSDASSGSAMLIKGPAAIAKTVDTNRVTNVSVTAGTWIERAKRNQSIRMQVLVDGAVKIDKYLRNHYPWSSYSAAVDIPAGSHEIEVAYVSTNATRVAELWVDKVDLAADDTPPPPPTVACADGVDNDGDSLTDHPDDPGCSSAGDTDETDPLPLGGSGASLGVFPGNQYGNPAWDTNLQALRDFENLTASHPKYVEYFHAFSGNGSFLGLPPAVKTVADAGYVPVITWEADDYATGQPYTPHEIAAGSYDSYLSSYADQVAAIGKEVDIRLFHEMNGSWYPWGVGKAGASNQDHIDAWRHVRDVFQRRGATNAKFVWNPNERHNQWTDSHPYADYYPGDAYVDYLALDGYNWAAAHNASWYSFDQVFKDSYSELAALNATAPVMIAEHASHTCCDGDKARWITDEGAVVPTNYPRVKVLTWFQSNQEGAQWRTDTSTASNDAYKALAADPYFGGA